MLIMLSPVANIFCEGSYVELEVSLDGNKQAASPRPSTKMTTAVSARESRSHFLAPWRKLPQTRASRLLGHDSQYQPSLRTIAVWRGFLSTLCASRRMVLKTVTGGSGRPRERKIAFVLEGPIDDSRPFQMLLKAFGFTADSCVEPFLTSTTTFLRTCAVKRCHTATTG